MTLCFSIAGVDPVKFEEQYTISTPNGRRNKKGIYQNPMDGIMIPYRIPGIVQLNATRIVRRNPVTALT